MPTFPVDLLDFLGTVRASQQVFDLSEGLQVQNRTAGGEVLRSGGAARLWSGSIELAMRSQVLGRELQAKLHALRGPGACFYIGDMTFTPAAGTAQIKSVTSSGLLMLQAAPVGRVIAPGDYLSWDYAGRRAFHQVVSGRKIASNGESSSIEVVPPIRSGWAAGATVELGLPRCLAVMVPGTLRIGRSQGVRHDGASFDWTQTLREVA